MPAYLFITVFPVISRFISLINFFSFLKKIIFRAQAKFTSVEDIQDEEEVISPATPSIRNLQKLHGHIW